MPPEIRCARHAVSTLVLAISLAGCMSWVSGWETGPFPTPAAGPEIEASIATAESAFRQAGSAAELARVLSTLESLLARAPQNQRALLAAAQAEILHGAAYDERRAVKAASYRRGIQYAERAMATNPDFAEQVRAGAALGKAVSTLDAEQAEAMLLWVTGVSYYFKECLSGLGHALNFRWMLRASDVMHHLMEVAPEFEHGAVPFSLGIYYLALPRSAGRDLERANALLEEAVAQSGSSLLPRWGRAKYFWVKTGDQEAFRSDLEWVLAQDPRNRDSPYAWNVYFQRDARGMLERIEQIF